MSCSICDYTGTWFKEYMKHPFGSGASMGDYALTILLACVLLYALYKVVKEVR